METINRNYQRNYKKSRLLIYGGFIIFAIGLVLVSYSCWDFATKPKENDDFLSKRTHFFEPTTPPPTTSLEWINLILLSIAILLVFSGAVLTAFGVRKRRSLTSVDEFISGTELQALDEDNANTNETSDFISSKSKKIKRSSHPSEICNVDEITTKNATTSFRDQESSPNKTSSQVKWFPVGLSRKRNILELFKHSPPKDTDFIVLFPERYPYTICDTDTLEKARRIVFESELNLRTKYITLEENYIKIKCLKNTTRTWFYRTDPGSFLAKLHAEVPFEIRIESGEYFSKRISLFCILTEPTDSEEFLTIISCQNNLNSSRSKFYHCERDGDCFQVSFGVTPMCFKNILDMDMKLKVKSKVIKVELKENPYQELFGANYDQLGIELT